MFLALPEPYDFELSTERFRAFGSDLASLWVEGALHRVIAGREVRIASADGGVEVEPFDDELRPTVEWLLGLAHPLTEFISWSATQPVLDELVVRLVGFRPPVLPEPFEALITSITAQQVSLRSATAIRNRLIERFGTRAELAFAFPTKERIAAASEAELVAVGFSRPKAAYVIGLARDEIDLNGLGALGDDEIRARLTAIRGLGPWTAEWFLARHLARPRAWPVGDLVLRKAVKLFYGVEVTALGPQLDPFQNLAAHYLLTGLRTP